jgi:septal ring factor EnvC (AmiA/AmiB activator)
MTTALPLFAYACANGVDTDHARDAYDAVVRGLPGGPSGILDALAEIGMVPGTLQEDLQEAQREIEELCREVVNAESLADTAQGQVEDHKETIADLRAEVEHERKRVGARDDTITTLSDQIADLREEIAQLRG